MSNHNAKETVDHVSKALDGAKSEGDQTNALVKLQDEIRADTKDMNPAEQKAYMAQVTKELEARNQLPILAVAFAGQLGPIDKGELNGELRAANRAEREGNNTKQLEKAMLSYLINNYDTGADLIHKHNDEGTFRSEKNISKNDVTDKLAEFRAARDEQHRKENNQVSAEKNARALLDGGDKSLFNFIDRNNGDGRLTKKELQDYLNDARASGSDSGHFSKAKQQLVENILKDWDNRETGKWMRGGFNGDGREDSALTKQGLVNAAGKKNESELVSKTEPPKPGDPKPGDPKPGDKAKNEMEVKQGDSYWTIAGRILGDKATKSEIFAKMNELRDKNGDVKLYYNPKNPQKIKI